MGENICYISDRSGTEEEFTELNILLEDITVFRRDFEEAKELEKEIKRKKVEEDEKRGHDMRQAALAGMAGLYLCNIRTIKPLISHI